MKILVTGGAGFIGSFIVDELVRRGHQVRIFDSLEPQVHPQSQKPDYLNPEAEFIQGDVRDLETFARAIEGQEVIFHEAAAVGMGQSMYRVKHYTDINIGGTANLLEIIANSKHNVKKMIVASSQTGYGEGCCIHPTQGRMKASFRSLDQLKKGIWDYLSSEGDIMPAAQTPETAPLDCKAIYAITKRVQEEMVLSIGQTYDIPAVALRYFNVYGPRQSLSNPYTGVIAIFMSRMANGNRPVIYEDGLQSRDFISVHDIVQANMLALEKDEANGNVYNVGTGISTSIKRIAELLNEFYGTDIEPEITGTYRKGDTRHCIADITKIKTDLGFEPKVTLVEGMKELLDWAQNTEKVDLFEQAAQELAQRGLA